MKIKVTRAFHLKGKLLEVGKTADVPEALARELVSYNKAEVVVEKPVKEKKGDENESV